MHYPNQGQGYTIQVTFLTKARTLYNEKVNSKTTYDLHLEYTCEKFKKNNNKDDIDNSNNIDEDINKIINKNKKEKNVNKKNVNKKNAKKRKRSDSEDSIEEDFKPQKKKYH